MMLDYLIYLDDRARDDAEETAFKGRLIASNWPLYDKLYGDESYDALEQQMDKDEFYVPQNLKELKDIIATFGSSQPTDDPA